MPDERSLKASVGLLKAWAGGRFQKHSESWAWVEVPGAEALTLLPPQANLSWVITRVWAVHISSTCSVRLAS